MVISFDRPTGAHGNKGSSAQFTNYMEKENKQEQSQEQWFGHTKDEFSKSQVQYSIDGNKQGLGKNDGKFATGSINITEDEFKALGSTNEEREKQFKQFAKEEFTQQFAANFNKQDSKGNQIPIDPDNVNIYYKMERNRHYKGTDQEVKQGIAEQGEAKQGFNTHIHFIVGRKTRDGRSKISPTTRNRKEFDRTNLIKNVEKNFDKFAGYQREKEQTFEYANTMKNGTYEEKSQFLESNSKKEVLQEIDRAASRDLQQHIEKPLTKEPEHSRKEEQEIERADPQEKDRNKNFGLGLQLE
jgi:hypothetical protein